MLASIPIDQCPCTSVILYTDRAEVTRLVELELIGGQNQITVDGLSSCIAKDSIRVDGTGNAVINEVVYDEKNITEEVKTGHIKQEMSEKLAELKSQEKVFENLKTCVEKKKQVVVGIADQISKSWNGISDKLGCVPTSDLSMEAVGKFLSFYETTINPLDTEIIRLESKLNVIRKELKTMEAGLSVLEKTVPRVTCTRSVTVSLVCDVPEPVQISLTYTVSQATWTPCYNIRANTNESVFEIHYYAMIQQSTGENWNETTLTLSSAMPNIEGTCPQLGSQRVSFYEAPAKLPAKEGIKRCKRGKSMSKKKSKSRHAKSVSSHSPAKLEQAVTKVISSGINAMFEIAAICSIPSDGLLHKITIGVISMEPEFVHETVPSKSLAAYLQAKVTNTSEYTFLQGKMSVFVDGGFVTQTKMPLVSPDEEFWCSLGVDPAVKIAYKPPIKYQSVSGMLTKCNLLTFEQPIEIKNTKNVSIVLRVTDNLPLSTHEDIKVTIMEPLVLDEDSDAIINKENNVEWNLEIEENSVTDLVKKYQVEYPIAKDIVFSIVTGG